LLESVFLHLGNKRQLGLNNSEDYIKSIRKINCEFFYHLVSTMVVHWSCYGSIGVDRVCCLRFW